MGDALLAPGDEFQPELLPGARLFVAKLESAGEYTGERLFQQRPAIYKQVVLMLSQGHGSQFIADTLRQTGVSLSKNTVKAVRKREGETIDLVRERLAEEQFEFAAQTDEAARIILTEIMSSAARRSVLTVRDVQSLKVASGIAITNGQLLTGKATVILGVDDFSKPTEDLNAQLAAHIAGLKDASTHLAGEKTAQKEGGAGETPTSPATADQVRIVDVPSVTAADGQSPAQHT
jgi:hypothetical protein